MKIHHISTILNLLTGDHVLGYWIDSPKFCPPKTSNTILSQTATDSMGTLVFPVTHEEYLKKLEYSKLMEAQAEKKYGDAPSTAPSSPISRPHARKLGKSEGREVMVPPPIQKSGITDERLPLEPPPKSKLFGIDDTEISQAVYKVLKGLWIGVFARSLWQVCMYEKSQI
ncbi:uncharacterized protein MELLADRAFT_67349 [Melampsora larici-populina 98AG31]|uniref:Uncharacterized protein n=1 Tax=Melampsora larici-populina (strain 98AG31 / pathotype 3-4-7) TaxID=747676 RepID=F4S2S7_MELLP|nr:uncharacterized protein MELLADRAFT_67349 [Melampsora larici-populina 98AG31]EGG01075.1 hypothetical protein MELLADRAFT_67349 [Melampsora larici-populina 98AG31]